MPGAGRAGWKRTRTHGRGTWWGQPCQHIRAENPRDPRPGPTNSPHGKQGIGALLSHPTHRPLPGRSKAGPEQTHKTLGARLRGTPGDLTADQAHKSTERKMTRSDPLGDSGTSGPEHERPEHTYRQTTSRNWTGSLNRRFAENRKDTRHCLFSNRGNAVKISGLHVHQLLKTLQVARIQLLVGMLAPRPENNAGSASELNTHAATSRLQGPPPWSRRQGAGAEPWCSRKNSPEPERPACSCMMRRLRNSHHREQCSSQNEQTTPRAAHARSLGNRGKEARSRTVCPV